MSLIDMYNNRYMPRWAERSANDTVGIVGRYINAALAPWNSGGATVYLERAVALEDRVIIQTKLLPELSFTYSLDPFVWMSEEETAHTVGQQAFAFYRNRPCLPIDDHIVLGED